MLMVSRIWAIRDMVDIMESGFVPVGNTRIYYETSGEGPAVMFVHAGIADSRMWRSQMTSLADGRQMVSFDQRGFGRTNWVPGPYADRRDVVSVMDYLGIESAVIVGCSLGGAISMHVALESPDRVDGLVLVGAMARGWEPVDGWTASPLEDEALAAMQAGDIERALELEAQMWVVGYGRTGDDVSTEAIELVKEMDRAPLLSEQERNSFVEPFEPPIDQQLDDINVPTLVVVGEYDEMLLIESAEYLAGRLSTKESVVIRGAAHLPSLEQPDDFNEVLRSFLDGMH